MSILREVECGASDETISNAMFVQVVQAGALQDLSSSF